MNSDDNKADKPAEAAQGKLGVDVPGVIRGDLDHTLGFAPEDGTHAERVGRTSAPSALSSSTSGTPYTDLAKKAKEHKPRDLY